MRLQLLQNAGFVGQLCELCEGDDVVAVLVDKLDDAVEDGVGHRLHVEHDQDPLELVCREEAIAVLVEEAEGTAHLREAILHLGDEETEPVRGLLARGARHRRLLDHWRTRRRRRRRVVGRRAAAILAQGRKLTEAARPAQRRWLQLVVHKGLPVDSGWRANVVLACRVVRVRHDLGRHLYVGNLSGEYQLPCAAHAFRRALAEHILHDAALFVVVEANCAGGAGRGVGALVTSVGFANCMWTATNGVQSTRVARWASATISSSV